MALMAGRIVAFHNMNVPGLVPVLWKLLRMPSFNTRISSVILDKKHRVQKLKNGFHIDVKGKSSAGLILRARNGHLSQEVMLAQKMHINAQMIMVTECSKDDVQRAVDYLIGRRDKP